MKHLKQRIGRKAGNKLLEENGRIRQVVCVILSICISLVITGGIVGRRMASVDAKMNDTQKALAKEVFRFHVLANSDSEEDQEVKLKVRDAVIAYMDGEMSGTESGSADDTKRWAADHLDDIEAVADQVLEQEGYSYHAGAEVVCDYFPEKTYGDITFPAGYYEALRVNLGKAEGHNWWCVLYPGLCFTSQTCAVVSEEGKEDLKEALTVDEYEMVTAASEFKIRWFFFGGDL